MCTFGGTYPSLPPMVPLLVTIFYFTSKFVFLVPVKIAALFKRIFQSHTGTMKPYLDVA